MRIETTFTNFSAVSNSKVDRNGAAAAKKPDAERSDEAKLSTGNSSLEALSSGALSASEIRSERVASLRAAVISGTYAPAPQAIADAMFNELF